MPLVPSQEDKTPVTTETLNSAVVQKRSVWRSVRRKLLGALRRIAMLVLVVFTVVSIVTILIELVPGDPAGDQPTPEAIANFREKHGLDRPPFFFSFPRDEHGVRHFQWHGWNNRYVEYWRNLLHGDLGLSFKGDRPVLDLILERYPATLKLALAALLIALSISIPLGVLAGKNHGTWIDSISSFIALVGISLPGFVPNLEQLA